MLIITLRGSNISSSGISEEDLSVRISEIQQYGAELENAVTFILEQGFSETDIRFAHPDADENYGVISDNRERQVFNKNGGGATYRMASPRIQVEPTEWLFNAENYIPDVGSTENRNPDHDVELIAFLPNVTKQFCVVLNDKVGVINPGGDPPNDSGDLELSIEFAGDFNRVEALDDPDDILEGKTEGCFRTSDGSSYIYYRVILIR
ncbi:MAG: hypothetical protein AAF244_01655 [Pseudomonadota bacterium]